jgi:hypothetical protein
MMTSGQRKKPASLKPQMRSFLSTGSRVTFDVKTDRIASQLQHRKRRELAGRISKAATNHFGRNPEFSLPTLAN